MLNQFVFIPFFNLAKQIHETVLVYYQRYPENDKFHYNTMMNFVNKLISGIKPCNKCKCKSIISTLIDS